VSGVLQQPATASACSASQLVCQGGAWHLCVVVTRRVYSLMLLHVPCVEREQGDRVCSGVSALPVQTWCLHLLSQTYVFVHKVVRVTGSSAGNAP
jgi:hypothetical protein